MANITNETFIMQAIEARVKAAIDEAARKVMAEAWHDIESEVSNRLGEIATSVLREYRVRQREDVLVIEVRNIFSQQQEVPTTETEI